MRLGQPIVRIASLSCFFMTAACGALLADDGDQLAPKLRAAWEKYSELQEVRAAYMARSDLTGAIHAMERERANLIANIREHQVVVDGMPRLRNGASGRNSIHEEYVQELLMLRHHLTEMDRTLEELRFHMRELDEMALRQAELSGGRVKPNNRRDLLAEAQRLQKECQTAFAALKEATDTKAKASRLSRDQVLNRAMAAESDPGAGAPRLCSSKQFLAAFRQFCAGRRSLESTSIIRGSGSKTRKSASWKM